MKLICFVGGVDSYCYFLCDPVVVLACLMLELFPFIIYNLFCLSKKKISVLALLCFHKIYAALVDAIFKFNRFCMLFIVDAMRSFCMIMNVALEP